MVLDISEIFQLIPTFCTMQDILQEPHITYFCVLPLYGAAARFKYHPHLCLMQRLWLSFQRMLYLDFCLKPPYDIGPLIDYDFEVRYRISMYI